MSVRSIHFTILYLVRVESDPAVTVVVVNKVIDVLVINTRISSLCTVDLSDVHSSLPLQFHLNHFRSTPFVSFSRRFSCSLDECLGVISRRNILCRNKKQTLPYSYEGKTLFRLLKKSKNFNFFIYISVKHKT